MTPNPQYPGPQYPGQPYGAPPRTSGLAIAALICGIVGTILPCPVGLVAIGLGIAALVKIGNTPGLGGKAMAIIGMILPVALLPVFGVLAAIAIPNFIKFQARAKQAECKSNLKAAYAEEVAYYAANRAFSTNVKEIGFSPQRGNRYAYFLFDVGQVEDRSAASLPPNPNATGFNVDTFKHRTQRPLSYRDVSAAIAGEVKAGVHGQCPECSFVAVCAGNIDNDETLDVWSISDKERTSAKGELVPAGTPFNDQNDMTE